MSKHFFMLCLCAFSFFQLPLWGQQQQDEKVNFAGTVMDAKTGETLPLVVVLIKELDIWTTTDLEGRFSFKEIKPGTYTLYSSCLSYKEYEMKITLSRSQQNYKLMMEEVSLALKEVTVTATANRKINTSSSIGRTAIEHIQASSLTDVMQLLPGALVANPSLTKVNQITIRDIPATTNGEAHPTTSNAIGTSIIVDGATVSNDANLQTVTNSNTFESTANQGVDTRQLPVNNIESIEVIRGVASAQYGDLTSGAVIVQTKAGKSPYEVSVKTDPHLKQVAISKGFALPGQKGFLNTDLEYAYASKDNRTPATTFNRVTMGLGYSGTFNKDKTPLRFHAKIRGFMTLDKQKEDPDTRNERLYKVEDKEISINLNGNWMLSKPWITTLQYTLAGTYGEQYNYEKRWVSGTEQPTTSATTSGANVGVFLPAQYFSTFWVDGKPLNTQVKLMATLADNYGTIYNNAMIGAEWRMKSNSGKGKQYGEYQPASGLRPLDFSDIPAIHEYSFFVEDRITIPFGKQELQLSAGARFSNIGTDAVDYSLMIDPRFNGRYVFVDTKSSQSFMQYLSLRAGWGIQHKMPTLYYLYPDPQYTDRPAFIYSQGDKKLAVYETMVTQTNNPDLKAPRSTNLEIGMDIKNKLVTASFAYFQEKLTDAFSVERIVKPFYYTRHQDLNIAVNDIAYVDGKVIYDGQERASSQDSIFISYSRPGNGNRINKWGLEYVLDFGMIESLRTSLIVDGAYMHQKSTDQSLQMFDRSTMARKYTAIFAGTSGNGADNGRIAQRFNSNFKFITHIPEIRFVVSLTAQCVWFDQVQRTYSYNGKNLVYMKDDNGNIVPGKPENDGEHLKYLDPLQYMDIKGNIYDFASANHSDPEIQNLVSNSRPRYLMKDKLDPYFMLNLRLSKEIGRSSSFSFYANNLTSSNPKRYYQSIGQYQKMNPDIYFGAELKFKF